MLFHERFEQRHTQHFSFTFINTRCEKLMHVVAERMALQKRTSTMGFHQQLDRGGLLSFAAKYLGDDTFHLAAVTLIQ